MKKQDKKVGTKQSKKVVVNTNEARLQGTIGEVVNKVKDTNGNIYFKCDLLAMRTNGKTIDVIPLLIPESAVQDGCVIASGRRISLKGTVRTGWKKNDTTKLNMFVMAQAVYGTTIEQDFNVIVLEGTICKKPYYRYTPFGKEIADITLAVDGKFKSFYVPCIAWYKMARYSSTLKVGDKLLISGMFHSREYTKKLADGKEEIRTTHEISINTLEFKETDGKGGRVA